MLSTDFEQLKDFILAKNTYFNCGFANAFKDAESNTVLVAQGSDLKSLLPDDTLGNYFYLRNDSGIKHDARFAERVTDTGAQQLIYTDITTTYLIAIVKKANAYKLINNLRNTAALYDRLNIQVLNSNYNRTQIITEELVKMKQPDIAAVLQRLTTETIIKLTLQVSASYIPGNCIIDPF